MRITALVLSSYLASSLAAPVAAPNVVRRAVVNEPRALSLGHYPVLVRSSRYHRRNAAGGGRGSVTTAAVQAVSAATESGNTGGACAAPAAGNATAVAAEGEAGAEQEIEIEAAFGQQVALQGGDIKQDTLFPPSAVGVFEVEFQGAEGRTLVVTENKTPAAPPAGFAAVEPSSYLVQIGGGGTAGLTLQKIDYIFDANNAALAAIDLSTTQVGKLSADGCSFAIEQGELEFEVEENEITLTVSDLNGEWGFFVPVADQATGAAAGAADAAGADGVGADVAAEDEVLVNGTFNSPVAVGGGNVKTDITFPGNQAGEFEVEYNGTAANAITVVQQAPSGDLPTGFLFVDPTSFVVSTQNPTDPATDIVKIDYFYSEAVKASIDVSQGIVCKLDAASGTFVTEGLGEFEVELEEDEWTLTVPDLNGEWAMLVPQTALLR